MKLSALIFILIFDLSISAQTITGKVVDKRSKGIEGATVSLKVKGYSTTTDATGAFSLNAVGVVVPNTVFNTNRDLFLNGRYLLFINKSPEELKIELFDINGKKTMPLFRRIFNEGAFSLPLFSLINSKMANGLFIVRIVKGDKIYTLPFSNISGLNSGTFAFASDNEFSANKLATADSLIISKEKYITVVKGVDSDVSQDVGTITLYLSNDPDEAIEQKVDELLGKMTLDEKIAQTMQVVASDFSPDLIKEKAFGSVFNGGGYPFENNKKETWRSKLDAFHEAARQSRLGIPILYGIDAVHGVATIEGATIFPHNIGMGCTHDTALVAKMANITAKECRALGINLNFGPAISVVRNEKWGRSYEGFGETPEINSLMGAAYIRGLQGYGDLSRPDAMAACAKHFIGDGGTTDGVNGGVTSLSEATMKAIHLPPYQAAVSEGVASIMPSYNAWNRGGVQYRCTNDKYSLTDLLKTGLKWDGFCLSDWDAIPQAVTPGSDVYTADNIGKAVNAGIDMAMIAPSYIPTNLEKKINDYFTFLKSLVPGTVPQDRIDDAVRRILRVKFRLNLFAESKSNASLFSEFGSQAHRAVARECVRKSLVLLKNEDNVLPLKTSEKVVVVGPWANSLGAQCGGWTISWQGNVNNPTVVGTTILKGLQEVGGSNVMYDENGNNISIADKVVLVIGEGPYAEGQGDHGFANSPTATYKSCTSCDLYKNQKMSIFLSDCPNAGLLDKCFDSGKPVIVVLISGRPMIITQEIAKAKAFVAAWLPGSEGGGVADVLYSVNNANFTGRLTHTWPASFEQIPINTGPSYSDEQKGSGGTPLFEYGYGLSY